MERHGIANEDSPPFWARNLDHVAEGEEFAGFRHVFRPRTNVGEG